MPTQLPRDEDGFIDLEHLSDEDSSLDLIAIAPPPPLDDATWNALVAGASHVDPEALGLDLDRVTPDAMVLPGPDEQLGPLMRPSPGDIPAAELTGDPKLGYAAGEAQDWLADDDEITLNEIDES